MPRFEFEETCTSRPVYRIDAADLDAAIAAYEKGSAYLVSEEVEHNVLRRITEGGKTVAIPEKLRQD
jgi:hypothetical protein